MHEDMILTPCKAIEFDFFQFFLTLIVSTENDC